jgi:hypothetical protein
MSIKHLRTVGALLFAVACGSDGEQGPDEERDDDPAGTGFYVIATAISDDDGASTYVRVMDHVEEGELDLSQAREFAGWSDLKVHEGQLFVSSGEAPRVFRFDVSDDGKLVDKGNIDFGAYSSTANMYEQIFIAPDEAYLLGSGGEYVVWNPKTLEITGTIPLPELPARELIEPAPSLDRGMIVRDGKLFHAVAFTNYKDYEMVASSAILVTDIAQGKVVQTIEASCPDLNVVDRDASGNLYFSNWVYSPAATLLHEDAKACVIKIPSGKAEINESWTTTFADVTGGREAAALSVLASGRALVSVFFEDNQPFDAATDDIFAWVFGANWKSYTLDLGNKAASEVHGLGWHSGGYYMSRFDEKSYVLLPGDGYTTTTVYELSEDGSASPLLHTNGWATRLERVR